MIFIVPLLNSSRWRKLHIFCLHLHQIDPVHHRIVWSELPRQLAVAPVGTIDCPMCHLHGSVPAMSYSHWQLAVGPWSDAPAAREPIVELCVHMI
jgi:hypothetical protein